MDLRASSFKNTKNIGYLIQYNLPSTFGYTFLRLFILFIFIVDSPERIFGVDVDSAAKNISGKFSGFFL